MTAVLTSIEGGFKKASFLVIAERDGEFRAATLKLFLITLYA